MAQNNLLRAGPAVSANVSQNPLRRAWNRWIQCVNGGQSQSGGASAAGPAPVQGGRDCCLVLDSSPSMDEKDWKPSRLAGAKAAALEFIDRLAKEEPGARVAVIFYSGRAYLSCPLTAVDQTDRLKKAIDKSRRNWIGGTSISAALMAAAQQFCEPNRIWQVVLLTDGHHNIGQCPKSVVGTLQSRAVIECVGIGGNAKDVDEDLLRFLATSYPDGRKRYRWIGQPEVLKLHFRELAGRITRV
ncbi:MAG: vWA domain-containing protein [Planctomycetota bacterium]